MAAMIFKGPPHWGQCSMSISNTSFEQPGPAYGGRRRGRSTSAWSAEGVLALTGRFGMISGRSLALRPRRAKQAPPWPGFGREHAMETDEINRGRGTSAASRCMNSSGDITIGVVPSR